MIEARNEIVHEDLWHTAELLEDKADKLNREHHPSLALIAAFMQAAGAYRIAYELERLESLLHDRLPKP